MLLETPFTPDQMIQPNASGINCKRNQQPNASATINCKRNQQLASSLPPPGRVLGAGECSLAQTSAHASKLHLLCCMT
jgi:hypothetical protein